MPVIKYLKVSSHFVFKNEHYVINDPVLKKQLKCSFYFSKGKYSTGFVEHHFSVFKDH